MRKDVDSVLLGGWIVVRRLVNHGAYFCVKGGPVFVAYELIEGWSRLRPDRGRMFLPLVLMARYEGNAITP